MDGDRTAVRYGLYSLPLIFLVLFFFYPLGVIFDRSLRPMGVLELGSFWEIITSAYYRDTLVFTFGQALLSTALTLLLAIPSAYVFTRFRFIGKSTLLALATLPFVLPTVVVAAAFRALIWPDGAANVGLMWLLRLETPPLELERTLTAVLIAHVFYNYAIALRMIAGYWTNQSPAMDDAARVLGADGWRLWRDVRLPMLRPALTAAALLVFIFTFTSFGVVLILGGLEFATLEVEIYYQAQVIGPPDGLPLAAALSLVQIGVMFLMMVVYTRLQRNIRVDLQSAVQVERRPRTALERAVVGGVLLVMVLILFAPLLALVWRSLDFGGDLTQHYANLLQDQPIGRLRLRLSEMINAPPLVVIGNSLRFALFTTGLAVFFGVITAYLISREGRRWLDPLFMLPLATSAVTLGFGYIIAMDFDGVRMALNDLIGLDIDADWDLRSSTLLIPLAHTLVALPFVVRSVLPALRSIPPQVQEAAMVLGASPWQRGLRIELPLISRGILVGATFAFTVSMGEFGASIFVARSDATTIPLAVNILLGRAGTSGEAYAMSVILMAVCAVSFLLIERLRTAGIGEF